MTEIGTTTTRERTCIACGAKSDKRALMRIVRAADGTVSFDGTGRKPGRGAYICSLDCLEKALKARKVQRALKCNVTDEDLSSVREAIAEKLETATVKE